MKKHSLIIASLALLSVTTSFAGTPPVSQPKKEACSKTMTRAKHSIKNRLFVSFADAVTIKKLRKEFPDLHVHTIKGFRTCLYEERVGEGPVRQLKMVTIPNTPHHKARLREYYIKHAG